MRGRDPAAHLCVMTIGLQQDCFIAFPNGRAIILDVPRDRYRRLDASTSSLLADLLEGVMPDPSDVRLQYLLDDEILVAGAAAKALATVPIAAASQDLGDTVGHPAALGRCETWWALVVARRNLRLKGMAWSLAKARRQAALLRKTDLTAAIGLTRAFLRHRRWLTMPSHCLPDGLALHALLCRHGVSAELMIGIRDQPFAAHCWVQTGNTVLSDTVDAIAELTPILAL